MLGWFVPEQCEFRFAVGLVVLLEARWRCIQALLRITCLSKKGDIEGSCLVLYRYRLGKEAKKRHEKYHTWQQNNGEVA